MPRRSPLARQSRARDVTTSPRRAVERPLLEVQGARKGDITVVYDRGGWMLWMLSQKMGRERTFAALHEVVETYSKSDDHPLLVDILEILKRHAPDQAAFDRFVDDAFAHVTLPELLVESAKSRRLEGGRYETTVIVKNVGTGTPDVPIMVGAGASKGVDGPSFRAQSPVETATIAPGQASTVVLTTDFEPEEAIVDPFVTVLQNARKAARRSIDREP